MSADLRTLADSLARPEGESGSALAAGLGITRAAVWKRIERLRALGLAVESGAGRRYRLAQPVDWLDADRIRSSLSRPAQALLGELELHFELDSTSSEWARRAHELESGSVCLAESQSAGRGRRGRSWISPLGGGICLSVLWRHEQGLGALAGLSLAVGLALRRGLARLGLGPIGLKWPNDLQFGGRKLGGILVEASGEVAGPCTAVIGIGINVREPGSNGMSIDQPVASLREVATERGERLPARNELVGALLDALLPALAQFGREGFAPLRREWAEADALAGRKIRVVAGAEAFSAVASGVDEAGCLRVRVGNRERTLASAEVSVRAAP